VQILRIGPYVVKESLKFLPAFLVHGQSTTLRSLERGERETRFTPGERRGGAEYRFYCLTQGDLARAALCGRRFQLVCHFRDDGGIQRAHCCFNVLQHHDQRIPALRRGSRFTPSHLCQYFADS